MFRDEVADCAGGAGERSSPAFISPISSASETLSTESNDSTSDDDSWTDTEDESWIDAEFERALASPEIVCMTARDWEIREVINMARMRCVDLSFVNLGNEGIATLARGFNPDAELRVLRLVHTQCTDMGMIALSMMLLRVRQLRKLDLSENDIGFTGGFILAGCFSHAQQFRELLMHDTNLTSETQHTLRAGLLPSQLVCFESCETCTCELCVLNFSIVR